MELSSRMRWAAFVGLLAVLAGLALLRSGRPTEALVVLAGPEEVELTLTALQDLPTVERDGSYQNRYGNWSPPARYRGVLLEELVRRHFPELWPREVTVVAEDGYRVTFSVEQLVDPRHPVVLAYAKDGLNPPAWDEGPQIALLSEEGRVSNEAYGAESVGAYWVQSVVRLEFSSQ